MNEFEAFFDEPYKEIKSLITQYIKNEDKILDLGCNNGNLEIYIDSKSKNCHIYCVDNNRKSLEILKTHDFKNITIDIFEQDANIFLNNRDIKNIDVILVNTTLHEISDPTNQSKYLDYFFSKCKKLINPNGIIIIGDYFYPKDLSDEDVEEYIKYQFKTIKHSDSREKFIDPELIQQKALSIGFKIEYSNSLRAVKEINKRYVVTILKN